MSNIHAAQLPHIGGAAGSRNPVWYLRSKHALAISKRAGGKKIRQCFDSLAMLPTFGASGLRSWASKVGLLCGRLEAFADTTAIGPFGQ